MLADHFHAGRIRLLAVAGCLCLFGTICAAASSRHSKKQDSFAHAQHLRESLERHPQRDRTRHDYDRVMNAYRAIYHANPASPHAPASIFAVADLLAEQGRVLHDDKSLHDAIGQYEFLRTNYPHSGYRQSALLAEGEIYLRDLKDAAGARAVFEKFLRLYPHNQLASEARIELRDIRHAPHSTTHRADFARVEAPQPSSSAFTPMRHPTRPSLKHENPAAIIEAKVAPHREPSPLQPIEAARQSAPTVSHSTMPPLITGIRYWSTPVYTRIAIDLQSVVRYQALRVSNPDRIYFDLYGARLSPRLVGQSDHVIDGGFLHRIHAEQFSSNVTRIVLNVSDVSQYYAFFLPNPARLIIDVRGGRVPPKQLVATSAPQSQAVRPKRASPQNLAAIRTIGLGPAAIPADKIGGPLPARPSPSSLRARATPYPTTAPVEQTFVPRQEVAAEAKPDAAEPNQPKRQEFHAVAPQPTGNGQLSMVRALGLKINRIVIDAGHGGHDSGTLGPDGMEEKNVVLDVALRLGALLRQRLGADVIYTRDTDTFVPLETRTAIANKERADLFISIHANSSPDHAARGVETYYLSFTTSEDALEVAARENAVSNQSIHQLSDLVKKIALQDKLEESREFADDVQQSLYQGLETGNPGLRDRGVKKAPFVVLIGANMPSILTEISFLTNPQDASELRQSQYRERIAEALYRGVARYVGSLNGVRVADAATVAPR